MKQRAHLGKTNSIVEARHVKTDPLRLLHLSPEGVAAEAARSEARRPGGGALPKTKKVKTLVGDNSLWLVCSD